MSSILGMTGWLVGLLLCAWRWIRSMFVLTVSVGPSHDLKAATPSSSGKRQTINRSSLCLPA